jgi:hypothetical protein
MGIGGVYADAVPWPTFVVIGANKAGTTSMHHYLGQHPDVYMSPVKEPHFFSLDPARKDDPVDRAQKPWAHSLTYDAEAYLRLFDGVTHEHAIGESSSNYLCSPVAPARIKDRIPDARLVAILRDPVDRAVSMWSAWTADGREHLPFADAVAAERRGERTRGGLGRHYVEWGLYGRQVARYLEHFDRGRLHVVRYEDFDTCPRPVLREIFAFVGVDPGFMVDTTTRHNVTAETRPMAPPRRHWWQRARPAAPVPPTKPTRDEAKAAVGIAFDAELAQVEALLDLDVDGWRVVHE